MGTAIWSLSVGLSDQNVKSTVPIVTREGGVLAACHVEDFAKLSKGDPAAVRYGVPTFRTYSSRGSEENLFIAAG
jgi:hypothetical protein